jgi:hypothetical protein
VSFVEIAPINAAAGSGVLLASSVGDPEGTRTITSIVALLVVLGIGLVMLAVWLFKLTRPDRELLAPLEVMGERKWRRADPVWQRRRLDQVRPPTAQPLQPSAAPPDLDEAFDQGPSASGFDDLHDDAHQAHGAPAENVPSHDAPVDAASADDASAGVEADAPNDGDEQEAAGAPHAMDGNGDAGERPASRRPTSPTPLGIERPMELPEREIDPEILAAAMAELDAELRRARDTKPQSSD